EVRHLDREGAVEPQRHHTQPSDRGHRFTWTVADGAERRGLGSGGAARRVETDALSRGRSQPRVAPIGAVAPPLSAFTPKERRVLARVRTPRQVQRFLNALPYNTEPPPGGATLRTFRGVIREHTAHCLEAALTAAVILEHHGWPPLVLSFESIDELD